MATAKVTESPKSTGAAREVLENMFDFSQQDSPDDISVDNVINEFNGIEGAEVKVYRIAQNNKAAWLFNIHPSEFRIESLRDEYEGGNFLLRIYGVDEDGRKNLRASPRITVEAPKKQTITPVTQQNDVAVLAQAMMQSMSAGFENLGKLIIESRQSVPIPPMKSQEEIQNQFLQQMVIMKQLFEPKNAQPVEQQGTVEKALDMLQRGIELGKGMAEVRGEASNTDVLLETVKSIGPVLLSGMAQSQQRQAPQQIQQPAPVIPQPQVLPQQTPEHINPEENDMNFIQKTKLKMALGFLVDAAERDLSQVTYAELALDNLSDEELNAILNEPTILDQFAQIEPRINEHKLWFELLISQMKNLLSESDEGAINEETHLTTQDDATKQYSDDSAEGAAIENS